MVHGTNFDDEEAEMVPIHWMGNNRVEMMMVRKDDARVQDGVGKKEAMKHRESERKAWKRLARESERLLRNSEAVEEEDLPARPDPLADTAYRGQLLSSLRPPRLNVNGDVERRSQYASSQYQSEVPVEQRASAANLITSLFRGESTRMGTKAMCPFSGSMVVLENLPDHMEEWRSMMRAELLSIKMDAALGPKLGLFVVPEIPVKPEPPSKDSTPEEVKKWNDFVIHLMKCGYVLCKADDRKYHWTELRKRLEMSVHSRPWERESQPNTPRAGGSPRGSPHRRRSTVVAME
eukprot:TRINITY_DN566_c0_g1_i1.p1 TRINITY_DN566_c0_g1~~TRINITY_DN566_c0_g1_i1.p1  ORF type:complete len:292 (+),score=52.79 TRINITY_DN566_c0_g1_i1:87-962(+)